MSVKNSQSHSLSRQIAWKLVFLLSSLAGLAGLSTLCLLLTTEGAELATRFSLSHYLGLRHIAIGRITGNVFEGFTAYEVQIPGLIKRYPGSTLAIGQAQVAPILSWNTRGPVFSGKYLRLNAGPLAKEITAERAQGSVFGGIGFSDLLFRDVYQLPPETAIDVQQLESGWPIGWRKLRSVQNGRLRLPESDPVVFYGSRADNQVTARVFSKAVDAHEVLSEVLKSSGMLKDVRGTVNDANLTVNNTGNQWSFKGTFQIASLSYKEVNIMNNAGRVDLQLQASPSAPTGKVIVWGGAFTAKQVRLFVRPSTLLFAGDWFTPALDLNGNASIGTTKIQVALKGTKQSPKLILDSEPPLAQETLLLMLVTGKTWRSAREALAQGEISSELATDFIDYVFFGGAGNRMARWFGITDIAITQDVERNRVGAQTTFADRVTLDVEVDPNKQEDGVDAAQPAGSKQSLPLSVGAEYQVTDSTAVRLEGERSPVEQKSLPQEAPAGVEGSLPTVDNTVLLKVKKRF